MPQKRSPAYMHADARVKLHKIELDALRRHLAWKHTVAWCSRAVELQFKGTATMWKMMYKVFRNLAESVMSLQPTTTSASLLTLFPPCV